MQPGECFSWRQAVSASDLTADAKFLLLTLSLFMNEEGESCFPSISKLEERCSRSRPWVVKHLKIVKEAGWIAVDQHGYRGKKWRRNEYVALWPERDLQGTHCCPDSDINLDEMDQEGGKRGLPPCRDEGGKSQSEGGKSETVKVVNEVNSNSPYNNPDNSPTRMRARETEKSRVEIEKQFDLAWHDYDNRLKSSRETALKVWLAMDQSDRDKAQAMIGPFRDQWVSDGGTLSRLIAFQTYLKDRKFDELPEPSDDPGGDDGRQDLKRYGSAWMVARLAVLRKGPKPLRPNIPDFRRHIEGYPFVNQLDVGPMIRLEPSRAVPDEVLAKCVSVKVGSEEWVAWQEYHNSMDWPFVRVDGHVEFVWFPADKPENWKWYQLPSQEPAA